jgi:hypothetical protein
MRKEKHMADPISLEEARRKTADNSFYIHIKPEHYADVILRLGRHEYQYRINGMYAGHALRGEKWVPADNFEFAEIKVLPGSETERELMRILYSLLNQGFISHYSTSWDYFQRVTGAPDPMPEDGSIPLHPVRPPVNRCEKGECTDRRMPSVVRPFQIHQPRLLEIKS